jgi:SAM-dependent methyltransferase
VSEHELHAHYERGEERDRFDGAFGTVEYERTLELLRRHLPSPPAVVADIGGGPGRYALTLAADGFRVVHRDLVPLHVQQLEAALAERPAAVSTAVGDARSLDLADESADAVLLLGPLYHLPAPGDRLLALREARRIVKPGGPVFVAAISRWAPRLHGELVARLGDRFPSIGEQLQRVEESGVLPPLFPGSFSGYCHRPSELADELRDAALDVLDLVAVEGIAFALPDLDERLADPDARAVVFAGIRALERVPELLGLGPHLVATARRGPD